MTFELPVLPYETYALEPYLSAKTVDTHHRNFHLAYLSKLGSLIRGTRFENADIRTIIREADGNIFNNAAQAWNHSFYFSGISPRREYTFKKCFTDIIDKSFGSFRNFREAFIEAAATFKGSGWVWLVVDENGKVRVISGPETESPLKQGKSPVLAIDVCDHAYQFDYLNRRVDYVHSFWNVINWDIIQKRFCTVFAKNGFKKTD